MSEIILQTIVEKLERLESLIKRQDAVRDDAAEQSLLSKIEGVERALKVYTYTVKSNNETLRQLSSKLDVLTDPINTPIKSKITHTHHLHKGVWVSVVLFVLCALLFALLIRSGSNTSAW
jgi:hypothetical protein